jgi:uncharacterized membrane protein
MSTPRHSRNAMALLARFGRDKRANIAVIFGIAVIPIITGVGVAIDYSTATRMKAKLQSAADAASVASISQNSAGYKAAAAMTSNGSVAAGVAEVHRHVQRAGPGVVPGCHRFPEPHDWRHFESEQLAAGVSRFLSDAGRFGVDGPAVDDGRSRADAVDQPG